jgi:hypothetical protein
MIAGDQGEPAARVIDRHPPWRRSAKVATATPAQSHPIPPYPLGSKSTSRGGFAPLPGPVTGAQRVACSPISPAPPTRKPLRPGSAAGPAHGLAQPLRFMG